MINTAESLADFFWFCGLREGVHSVNVTTKVKKEIMTGRWQNKVACNQGCVVEIKWKNQGGGVWQASVEVV